MKAQLPRDQLLRRLGALALLRGVDDGTLERVADAVSLRELRKKEAVLLKGDSGEHLLFLLDGRLQVLDVTESGREIGLNLLNRGDYFGELSVIDGEPRSATVVALEKSLVALVPKAQASELFYRNPLVAERILRGLARQIRNASVYQTILCLPNASQRVYALLQHMIRVAPGGLVVIEQAPKHHQVAIMVNTSRETVSRATKRLMDSGVLEKDNRRWIVRDPATLLRLAQKDTP